MKDDLKKRVEKALDSAEDTFGRDEGLKKVEEMIELFRDVKPRPYKYPFEKAFGLPTSSKEKF